MRPRSPRARWRCSSAPTPRAGRCACSAWERTGCSKRTRSCPFRARCRFDRHERVGGDMIDRREFLKIAGLTAAWPCAGAWAQGSGVLVNDLHSQLNPTRVDRVVEPETLDAARAAIAAARREQRAVCIAGGRHAMGAQAFATDGVLLDIRKLDRVLGFDMERGQIEVESGMQWPKLLAELTEAQRGRAKQWGFAQKQTGADRLTMGGCLSANVHGRGLFSCYRPVADSTPIPAAQKELAERDWTNLLLLAHTDKAAAFKRYANYYLATNGQVYWSDEHQMSIYPDYYHREIDRRLKTKATEAITEIYCERDALERFMVDVAADARRNETEIIYGTVRLIEVDRESFLAWAKKPYACVDRKSTRLNSSHLVISYAVFCLKKQNK